MSHLKQWWQSPRNQAILFVLLSALMMALFLGFSAITDRLGFPLDDAWIHQTYARNFARNGRWEFIPGVVSGGSTSPLWTLLLALGYLLRLPYLWWAYALGFFSLLLTAFSAHGIATKLWPERKETAVWSTITIICTWPLLWAAASGMETLLFVGWGLFVLNLLLGHLERPYSWRSLIGLGVCSGLLILIRPDGLVVILLVFASLILQTEKRWQVVGYILAITAVLLPYFLFNYSISGTIWPNTFYAKQTEYAALLEQALIPRFFQLLYFSLGGASVGVQGISAAHLLLLPGIVVAGWQALRRDWQTKRLFLLVPLLWAGGHIALYAWRLPLMFQHGRYLMAATPIWIFYGFAGWALIWQSSPLSERMNWLLKQTAVCTFGFLLLFFLFFGGQAYARDVAFIENEMVDIAHWLAENTAEDALIASHDIGAIGYFAERPLLDLAGLITPDIIPSINNETEIEAYILHNNAQYLVTAPGWPYQEIVDNENITPIYNADYPFTRENGLNNMTIYLLNTP